MKIIEHEDYVVVRELAKKYNMSIADFGRAIVRQSERSVARAIRLSESEYQYIRLAAENNNMTAARFCALACHLYLQSNSRNIPIEYQTDNGNKTRRIEVRIYNVADEIELIKIAATYSMKISALIRYCAIHFDGIKIKVKGDNDDENQ